MTLYIADTVWSLFSLHCFDAIRSDACDKLFEDSAIVNTVGWCAVIQISWWHYRRVDARHFGP